MWARDKMIFWQLGHPLIRPFARVAGKESQNLALFGRLSGDATDLRQTAPRLPAKMGTRLTVSFIAFALPVSAYMTGAKEFARGERVSMGSAALRVSAVLPDTERENALEASRAVARLAGRGAVRVEAVPLSDKQQHQTFILPAPAVQLLMDMLVTSRQWPGNGHPGPCRADNAGGCGHPERVSPVDRQTDRTQ